MQGSLAIHVSHYNISTLIHVKSGVRDVEGSEDYHYSLL